MGPAMIDGIKTVASGNAIRRDRRIASIRSRKYTCAALGETLEEKVEGVKRRWRALHQFRFGEALRCRCAPAYGSAEEIRLARLPGTWAFIPRCGTRPRAGLFSVAPNGAFGICDGLVLSAQT